MTMGNNNNNAREEINRAYTAVQTHVLPGLGDAWDEAGPAVVLVLAGMMSSAWRASGFQTFDLIRMINAQERVESNLAW
jgi:hypothetical protein